MKNKFSDDTLNRDSLPEHNQEPTEKGKIKLLDVVALTQDIPEHNLKRGEVGTVVEILSNGEAFEVEFSDDNGQMYKCLSFPASQLKVLHQEPIETNSKPQADNQLNGYIDMNRYRQTFRMFYEGRLSEYLGRKRDGIQQAIQYKSEDYILNVNETEYINYLVGEFTIDSVNINFEGIFIDPVYEKDIPAEHFPEYHFAVEPGKSYSKPATIYHIPYSGNEDLFQYAPSNHLSWGTEVFLDDQCLCFEVVSLSGNAEEMNENAQKVISDLKTQLEYLAPELEKFNDQLPTIIKGLFQEHKQEILDKHQFVASLGVPVKKRKDLPETYAIPTPEIRKSVNLEPRVTEVGYKPEPTLPDSVYHDILQTIHDVGKTFERLPSTYSDKDEEALRDHLLLYLEPRFKGSATGETFNKTGKTDILIRHENSNVFIAECKFWQGQKAYLDTITQLLGYLMWRDSKSSVIVFVRNKDLSSVLKKAEEVTPDHPNYLGFVDKKDDTWFNYRLHINDDPNREVKLGVLFFHVPEQERT